MVSHHPTRSQPQWSTSQQNAGLVGKDRGSKECVRLPQSCRQANQVQKLIEQLQGYSFTLLQLERESLAAQTQEAPEKPDGSHKLGPAALSLGAAGPNNTAPPPLHLFEIGALRLIDIPGCSQF